MNIEQSIEKAKEFINYLPIGARIISFRKGQFIDCQIAIETLLTAYEKEKEKNKEAYRKANNYLYFNDSADYEVALWEVIRTLRPDLAEKWDNGEDAILEYIEEE